MVAGALSPNLRFQIPNNRVVKVAPADQIHLFLGNCMTQTIYLEPGSPFKEIPDDIDIYRVVLKIDPKEWIPIESTDVDHRTPTPEGWVDVWVYRHALSTLKRDDQGHVIQPIPLAFDARHWQEMQIPSP